MRRAKRYCKWRLSLWGVPASFLPSMKDLVLYDTASRTARKVEASDGKSVRIYCCGPTVYGPAHIGNFRTFIMQDVLRRTLEVFGHRTTHVRNLTDLDDKTIRQSQAEGRTLTEFTSHWRDRFHADCAALNLLAPHVEPSAVGHIPHQIRMIQDLVAKGHAYVSQGSVYFKVESFPDYGSLSRLKEREVITGASGAASVNANAGVSGAVEDADEYQRETAADFVLWKARKTEDGPNFWPSPWGDGRPGWHLECSAMAREYLGCDIDLHSGGIDLIFPHHENEIAQSVCATGCGFVRHWFHGAHLTVDKQKMSKSLGNLFTLADVQARGFTAAELRYVLLSGHYGKPLNFTWDTFTAARSALGQMARAAARIGSAGESATPVIGGRMAPVFEALADDLNTPKALGALFSVLDTLQADDAEAFSTFLGATGIRLDQAPVSAQIEIPSEVKSLAEARWAARLSKNWAESDRLRDELKARGWAAKDGKEGYTLARIA
ncbi:MAG: cysteine--tRNA ligase [Candidatus Methylacidiphilales bacterium]|nr:cysteine--tRNA ligase [Candidatus Methylacidiphilales bacterium]